MNIWSKRIKEKRKKLNLTLVDVSKCLGVTESTVQRYESGNIKNIPYEHICKLANLFNCSPSFLMGWEDENIRLNKQEQENINKYRRLSNHGKKEVDKYLNFRLQEEINESKEEKDILNEIREESKNNYFDLNIAAADGSSESIHLSKEDTERTDKYLKDTEPNNKDTFEEMRKKLKEAGLSEKDIK